MKRIVFTPKALEELKKLHKCDLIKITVFLNEDKTEKAECVIKDPLSLPDMSMMSAIMSKKSNLERGEYILQNLMVAGDDDFKLMPNSSLANNTRVRFSACIEAYAAVNVLAGEVAKV